MKDKVLFATFDGYLVEQTLRNVLKQWCFPTWLRWSPSTPAGIQFQKPPQVLVFPRVICMRLWTGWHALPIPFKRSLSVFGGPVPQQWPQLFISKTSHNAFTISPSHSATVCGNVFLPVTTESSFPDSGWSPSIFSCLALADCLSSFGSSKWAAPPSLLFPVALLNPSYSKAQLSQ